MIYRDPLNKNFKKLSYFFVPVSILLSFLLDDDFSFFLFLMVSYIGIYIFIATFVYGGYYQLSGGKELTVTTDDGNFFYLALFLFFLCNYSIYSFYPLFVGISIFLISQLVWILFFNLRKSNLGNDFAELKMIVFIGIFFCFILTITHTLAAILIKFFPYKKYVLNAILALLISYVTCVTVPFRVE